MYRPFESAAVQGIMISVSGISDIYVSHRITEATFFTGMVYPASFIPYFLYLIKADRPDRQMKMGTPVIFMVDIAIICHIYDICPVTSIASAHISGPCTDLK